MDFVKRISRPRLIRLQILAFLQFSYIYYPVRRFCKRIYARNESGPVNQLEQQTRGCSDDISDLIGFGNEHTFVKLYKKCSSAVLVYVIIRAILPLETVIGLFNPSLPPHCYVLGRFILWGPMAKNFDVLIASYHVSWRIWRDYLNRYLKLDLAAFLVINNEAVERNFGRDGEGHDPEKLSTLDKYLSSMMYYVVEPGSKTLLRLRPNRSKESYHELRKMTAKTSIVITVCCSVLIVTFAPLIIYSFLLDSQYVKDFPMCSPQLDEFYRNPQHQLRTMTPRKHKIFANIIDFAENLFLWLDNCSGMGFSTVLVYLLNRDMQIYWRHLHKHISKLLLRVRVQHHQRMFREQSATYQFYSRRGGELADLLKEQSVAIECDSYEVQAMSKDFFKQLRLVNEHSSKYLLFALVIWLSYFSCATYLQIKHPNELQMIGSTKFVAAIMFGLLTLISTRMFALRRNVFKTYYVICSLMAYDMSSYKLKYIRELEYFTCKNRASYTIGNKPFTPLTVLTIIGWTFSCAAIVENFSSRGGSGGHL